MQDPRREKETPKPNEKLKEARERRGWSQEFVAHRLGTTQANVSRWESGATFPTPHFRQELSELFGMKIEALGLLPEAIKRDSKKPHEQARVHDEGGEKIPHADRQTGAASAAEASAPGSGKPLWWPLRPERNLYFSGREPFLQLLRRRFTEAQETRSERAVLPITITGLGGVGKTQVALEYAWRYRSAYQTIIWVQAGSHEKVLTEYEQLARLLGLPAQGVSRQVPTIDVVRNWFADHTGWLLVFDNAEEPAKLQNFFPEGSGGHILLTSRNPLTGISAQTIELEGMQPEEGALLLLRRAKIVPPGSTLSHASETDRKTALELSKALGGLPLALDQAGAYIEETTHTLSSYLHLYGTEHKHLLKERSARSYPYPASVATTWSLALKIIRRRNRAAAELLYLLALLDPDRTSVSMIQGCWTSLGLGGRTAASSRLRLDAAVRELRRFSLIQIDAESETLAVHRLVQTVLRDSMGRRERLRRARRIIRALNRAFAAESVYLAEARACAALIAEWHIVSKAAANVLIEAGSHAQQRKLYRWATPLLLQALPIAEQAFGAKSVQVVGCLAHLFAICREQERYDEAESLCRRALDICGKIYGPGHPMVAEYYRRLAGLYRDQLRSAEAEACYQQALTIYRKTPLPAHGYLRYTLHELARLYHDQRRYEQSETLYREAVSLGQRVWGAESVEVAISSELLAGVYIDQKKFAEATRLVEQVLAIYRNAYGENSTGVARSLRTLGDIAAFQGMFEQAEPFYQQALEIVDRPQEPQERTVATNAVIAIELFEWAEPLHQQGLEIVDHLQGEVATRVSILESYSQVLLLMGREEEAAQLFARALEMVEEYSTPTTLDGLHAYLIRPEEPGEL